MKQKLQNWWRIFCRWKGWAAFARFWVKLWRTVISWPVWGAMFDLPVSFLLFLGAACAAALIWVFVHGREQWVPAYALYAVSAYTLTALCVKLPGTIRDAKQWIHSHPKIEELLSDHQFHFTLELYFEQMINFAYGIFKIVSGVVIGSAWVGADGIYNLVQALIQLFQILRRKRGGTLQQQWRSYRFCGVLILLMHLTLTGIVFQMVNWNRAEEHGMIMILATASFAFYKIITSFWDVAKDRKHRHPIDSSVRMLDLSQAIFAIFSLQASMLHTFGTGEPWEGQLNTLTGCVVCLLVAAMGVYMIRRGSRELKQIQENEHGTT